MGEDQNTTVEIEATTLTEILESFEYFLKGSGFHFEGRVCIDDDENCDV